MRFLRLLAPLGALLLAPAASAWGPFTHCVVNQLALEQLRDKPGFEVLKDPRRAELFVKAGSAADLAFSIRGGGKMDPAMNAVLHQPAFHTFLLKECRARGDLDCEVFALGLGGHLAGDRAGNVPESPSSSDPFGWPTGTDIFGAPVPDADASAAAQLRGVTVGINKLAIDGLMRAEEVSKINYLPYVPRDDLVAALQAYTGPDALPNGTEAERAHIAEVVPKFARTFRTSFVALRTLGRRVFKNRRLRGPLREAYGGEGRTLPMVPASVARAVADLEVLNRGEVAHDVPAALRRPGPAPGEDCLDDRTPGLAEALGVAVAEAGVGAPGSDVLPAAPSFEGVAGPAAPVADPAARTAALSKLKRKVMTTYASQLMVPRRSWGVLRARVRALVPAEAP